MDKLKCPKCGSDYIGCLTIHDCAPLSEQFLYQCGECQEMFQPAGGSEIETFEKK